MSSIMRKGLQTKMFHSSSQEQLENMVNGFIKDKDVVDIKYNVVQDFNDYNCWDYSVLILYMNYGIDDFELIPSAIGEAPIINLQCGDVHGDDVKDKYF